MSSPFIASSRKQALHYSSIGYRENPLLALLVTLLTNLSSIFLIIDHGYRGDLAGVLDNIAQLRDAAPLSTLVAVHIQATDPDGDTTNGGHYVWFRRFAALPSVRTMHLTGFGPSNNEISDPCMLAPGQSGIINLKLEDCDISCHQFSDMLEIIGNLQSFAYPNDYEGFNDMEPFWMRAALLTYARHSLQSLIIIRPLGYDQIFGRIRGLEASQNLECEERCLLGREGGHGLLSEEYFPASMETITLYNRNFSPDFCACSTAKALVQGMAVLKQSHLKGLRALTLHRARYIEESGFKGCKEGSEKYIQDLALDAGFDLALSHCRCRVGHLNGICDCGAKEATCNFRNLNIESDDE